MTYSPDKKRARPLAKDEQCDNSNQREFCKIDTTELHMRIANRAEDYLRELFGDSFKTAGNDKWRVGKRGSLAVSIQDGALVYFSHEQGLGGDAVALWQRERGGTAGEALRAVAAWSGIPPISNGTTATPKREGKPAPIAMKLPDDATPGTKADWLELAALRHVSIESVCAATHLGTLLFGTVCGSRCWILTDARRLIAEARRMDGKLFPAVGDIGERKAHTIKGSVKSWPVGLVPSNYHPDPHAPLVVVEGGPDYLAAMHFAFADKPDALAWHPIAFLGAGTASAIHPEALPLLRGRRVRLYPHVDSAGTLAGAKWAAQFAALGATVDAFSFEGLRKATGEPIKDLNDCARIHPEDAAELEGLLP